MRKSWTLELFASAALAGCATSAQRGAIYRANTSYDRGDPGQALNHIARAKWYGTLPPEEEAAVLFLEAQCHERLQHPLDAIGLYRSLVERYPDSAFSSQARERLADLTQ